MSKATRNAEKSDTCHKWFGVQIIRNSGAKNNAKAAFRGSYGCDSCWELYEFRVRDGSEFVTLGKFSKILRLFLNIVVKVSRK
jgi:hypothetical protein